MSSPTPANIDTTPVFTPEQLSALSGEPLRLSPERALIVNAVLGRLVDVDQRAIEVQEMCMALPQSERILYTEDGLRVPSFKDSKYVFDEDGLQVFENGRPLIWTNDRYWKPGKRDEDATYPVRKTIDGMDLVPVDPTENMQTLKSIVGGQVFRWIDGRWDIEHLESAANHEAQKRLQEIVGSGPDNDARIWEIRSANGNTERVEFGNLFDTFKRRYNGNAVSPMEMQRYKDQIKILKTNRAETQARLSYSIGKFEEQEQGGPTGIWNAMLQFMHQELGYTQAQIMSVGIGLQYMKKGTYLTFKNRGIEYVGPDGTPFTIKPDGSSDKYSKRQLEQMQANGQTTVRLGKLKARAYATELADKLKAYEYSFSAADVAEIMRLSIVVSKKLGSEEADKNGRAYQNAVYILRKLKVSVDASRMGSNFEPGKEGGVDAQQFSQLQQEALLGANRSAGMEYQPSINASAEAKRNWILMAAIVDSAAMAHPLWREQNVDQDYASVGDIELK